MEIMDIGKFSLLFAIKKHSSTGRAGVRFCGCLLWQNCIFIK
jgi:hypothetical protein